MHRSLLRGRRRRALVEVVRVRAAHGRPLELRRFFRLLGRRRHGIFFFIEELGRGRAVARLLRARPRRALRCRGDPFGRRRVVQRPGHVLLSTNTRRRVLMERRAAQKEPAPIIAISGLTPTAPFLVIEGQWGGASGAICEDHLYKCALGPGTSKVQATV